jgi:SAM-dependent methyltransferase
MEESDFELLGEYYSMLERQGPGSPETTLKALSFVEAQRPIVRIADIGCGTGAHTLLLAEHLPGSQVTALDLFPVFIEQLSANAAQAGLQDRVKGITGNMEDLPFKPDSLDLIWSEGAIYNIGFERGIREWWAFLKTGGYLAVSEITWLTQERPSELQDYWSAA